MSRISYGGQAVIEGVMMKGKHFWAIAVRKADSQITIKDGPVKSVTDRLPFLRWPVLRGFVTLFETLALGMRSITYSANEYAEEEGEELTARDMVLTVGLAVLLTVGLFIALPAFIIRNIQDFFATNVGLNLVEGLIKITFFILYILGISLMQDIKRVFQYHGAEHKAINCYEANQELTVENVKAHSTRNARCGTNFLLIVMFVSIFIFSFFGRPPFFQRIGIHLMILPLVAGISYEIIKAAGKENCHPLLRLVAFPGMMLQGLTTREPDASQIQVAVSALEAVTVKDAARTGAENVKPLPHAAPALD